MNFLLNLLSFCLGLVFAYFVSTALMMFEEENVGINIDLWSRKIHIPTGKTVVQAVTIGVIVALISRLPSTRMPSLIAVPCYLAGIMLMLGFLVWWTKSGSAIKELLVFIVLDFLVMLAIRPASARLVGNQNSLLGAILRSVPSMLFIMSIGYYIANMIWFKVSLRGGDRYEDD